MFDDEKLRVTLNIAGEQVKTVINRSDEEELRMLEKEVTSLFNRWRVADRRAPSRKCWQWWRFSMPNSIMTS